MKRNKNIELLRGIAISYMILYHYISSISGFAIKNYKISLLIESLGQFALIGFFVISGFGTYLYFDSFEKANKPIKYREYIGNRLKAILPHYWLSIAIIIFLMKQGSSCSISQFGMILRSIFLLHNYTPDSAINGVTWTIAVLVQLYLLAIPMYYFVKKKGIFAWVVAAILCITLKRVVFYCIGVGGYADIWYVVAGIRTPFTTFDLFIAGMCSAHLYLKHEVESIKIGQNISLIWLISCMGIFHIGFIWFGISFAPIWGNSFIACIWQSIIGLIVAICLWGIARAQWEYRSFLGRGIQFVAYYEYGIYLWHMQIMGNFLTSTPDWFILLNERAPFVLLIIMVVLAVTIGYVASLLVSSESYKKLFIRCMNKKEGE